MIKELHTIQAPDGHIRQGYLYWLNYVRDFLFAEGRRIFYGNVDYWTVKRTPVAVMNMP